MIIVYASMAWLKLSKQNYIFVIYFSYSRREILICYNDFI